MPSDGQVQRGVKLGLRPCFHELHSCHVEDRLGGRVYECSEVLRLGCQSIKNFDAITTRAPLLGKDVDQTSGHGLLRVDHQTFPTRSSVWDGNARMTEDDRDGPQIVISGYRVITLATRDVTNPRGRIEHTAIPCVGVSRDVAVALRAITRH